MVDPILTVAVTSNKKRARNMVRSAMYASGLSESILNELLDQYEESITVAATLAVAERIGGQA